MDDIIAHSDAVKFVDMDGEEVLGVLQTNLELFVDVELAGPELLRNKHGYF